MTDILGFVIGVCCAGIAFYFTYVLPISRMLIKFKGPDKNDNYFMEFVAHETIGCVDINHEMKTHPERFEWKDGLPVRKNENKNTEKKEDER